MVCATIFLMVSCHICSRFVWLVAKMKTTMIIVTHEMSFARGASDTVAFLYGGTVAEMGPPDRIFTAPETEELRRFLSVG